MIGLRESEEISPSNQRFWTVICIVLGCIMVILYVPAYLRHSSPMGEESPSIGTRVCRPVANNTLIEKTTADSHDTYKLTYIPSQALGSCQLSLDLPGQNLTGLIWSTDQLPEGVSLVSTTETTDHLTVTLRVDESLAAHTPLVLTATHGPA